MHQKGSGITSITENSDCVVVTLVDVKGSAPREIGTQMIVFENALRGTIGGGSLEHQAISHAKQLLAECRAQGGRSCTRLERFNLNAKFDQCCGGAVVVLFDYAPAAQHTEFTQKISEYKKNDTAYCVLTVASFEQPSAVETRLVSLHEVIPDNSADDAVLQHAIECARNLLLTSSTSKPYLFAKLAGAEDRYGFFSLAQNREFNISLFGAGHVGQALVSVLSLQDCKIRWVDSRENIFPSTVAANVECVSSLMPAVEVSDAPAGSYFLVMTHSHELDYELCDHILARDDVEFLGLIGSKSKGLHFRKKFSKQGLDSSQIDRITCPIGISGLASKQPMVIAMSVTAQLLRMREAAASNNITKYLKN